MDPKKVQDLFYLGQIVVGGAFLAAAWFFFRPRTPESSFKVREADKKQSFSPRFSAGSKKLADAKFQGKPQALQLPGIRIDGKAHEILGVSATASPNEIQRAYRELMKRFHPDRIGRPGTREWQDAQHIADAIIRAKDEMLKSSKK